MKLTTAQRDRAIGAIVGMACGDALGAPFEFQPALINGESVEMVGGGGWLPGEWTDDTSMAIAILQAIANGGDLATAEGQSAVVAGWLEWLDSGPKDIGIQTSAVLRAARALGTSEAAKEAAADYLSKSTRADGNGSLMRTAPVALAFLHDADQLWNVAREISALTHASGWAQDACAMWCLAIRTAILEGHYGGLRDGLERVDSERRERWRELIAEAEFSLPHEFEHNGWVVQALQAAWSAIHHTEIPVLDQAAGSFPCQQAERAIEAAVRCGYDTDTVAAIAGALVGARWGVSALPLQWQLKLNGYPGMTGWDLIRMADRALTFATTGVVAQPPAVMPMESYWTIDEVMEVDEVPGLVLGGQQILRERDFDAVISLSRIGTEESRLPATAHARVWVMDSDKEEQNLNLHYLLEQVADLLHTWLDSGARVLLHCVQAQNRTPSFAVAYLVRHHGYSAERAIELVRNGLSTADPHGYLLESASNVASARNGR